MVAVIETLSVSPTIYGSLKITKVNHELLMLTAHYRHILILERLLILTRAFAYPAPLGMNNSNNGEQYFYLTRNIKVTSSARHVTQPSFILVTHCSPRHAKTAQKLQEQRPFQLVSPTHAEEIS